MCRRLVEATLTHMSELAFREAVLESLPEEFKPLMGPEPRVQPFESQPAPQPDAAEGDDAAMQNGHADLDATAGFGPQMLSKV